MGTDIMNIDGRRPRGAASREAALTSAVRIAEKEGLEGLSFGRVAGDAGMAKSSLQVLFGDRERLQLQTLAASIEAFAALVARRVTASRIPPSQPLLRLCESWFDVISNDDCTGGCLLTAALSEYRGREGAVPAAIRAGQDRWVAALRGVAAAAIRSGEIASSADIDQLVFELQAFQGAANVAAAVNDLDGLERARRASRERIERERPLI
jgi:AcrR family transcriptional regulator